jgi:NTP pyrophosphatase (non-canonical NTP hydrolase)
MSIMGDDATTVQGLKEIVRAFVSERAWERYHSPKNLAMGLAVEAAELMEHFLWVDSPASYDVGAQKREEVADELADVACHLLNLCNVLGMDLSQALQAKMAKNARKYPAEQYRGRFEV